MNNYCTVWHLFLKGDVWPIFSHITRGTDSLNLIKSWWQNYIAIGWIPWKQLHPVNYSTCWCLIECSEFPWQSPSCLEGKHARHEHKALHRYTCICVSCLSMAYVPCNPRLPFLAMVGGYGMGSMAPTREFQHTRVHQLNTGTSHQGSSANISGDTIPLLSLVAKEKQKLDVSRCALCRSRHCRCSV